jgi:predicted P-loop ATPase
MLAPTDDNDIGLRFLWRILPAQGYYIAAIKDPRSKRFRASEFASTPEGLWRLLQENDRNGFETYHACASFREPLNDPPGSAREDRRLGRTHHNALGAKAFWLDIDAGHDKSYPNQQKAFEAVKVFCKKLNLPIPIVVSSGAGLHIYWCLLQTLSPDDWGFYASGLEQLCVEHDLKADPSRTTDITSILRTPGTHNRKRAVAQLVECAPAFLDEAGPCSPQPIERFAVFADHAPREQGKKHSPASLPVMLPGSTAHLLGGNDVRARVTQDDLLSGIEDYPEVSGAEIANHCARMRQMRDKRGVLPEPLWYANLGVLAFCKDGDQLAHAWSSGDLRYSEAETSERLARARTLTGPTTCNKFHSLDAGTCEACPHFQKITSPTALGRVPGQGAEPKGATPISELQWEKTLKGALKPKSYANARKAIKEFGIRCRHDIFHDRKIIEGSGINEHGPELSDAHVRAIRDLILARYGVDAGFEAVLQAATRACEENRCDPVSDYLDSLRWDGEPRIDRWLHVYCGAEDTALNRAYSRIILVAAVRRARQPGYKFDQILVLEGIEGTNKSSAIELLAGQENFSDQTILGLDDQRQQERTRGVWLYEIADLAGMKKSEVEKVKAFASRTHDRARAAYARTVDERPRRCIFIGTTNDETYLRSQTGNRRFWPVKTGRIDLDALRRDRDQLWAEAAHFEKRGMSLVLPESLWEEASRQQEARREQDPWEEELRSVEGEIYPVSSDAPGTGQAYEERISTKDLLWQLGKNIADATDHDTKRIGHCMRRLGWTGPKPLRIWDKRRREAITDNRIRPATYVLSDKRMREATYVLTDKPVRGYSRPAQGDSQGSAKRT